MTTNLSEGKEGEHVDAVGLRALQVGKQMIDDCDGFRGLYHDQGCHALRNRVVGLKKKGKMGGRRDN